MSRLNTQILKISRTPGKFEELKRPRGFVRIIQLLFAIFAFASTAGFSGNIHIRDNCTEIKNIDKTYAYPFVFEYLGQLVPFCNPEEPLYGNFSAGARFYVFIGVMVFLYCIGTLLLYTVFLNTHGSSVLFRKIDFIVSLIIAILWFIASAAWASGVDKLKRYTSPDVIKLEIKGSSSCIVETSENYAGLNISLLFGFSNVALWGAGLWFLWKETPWFRGEADPMRQNEPIPEVDGSTL